MPPEETVLPVATIAPIEKAVVVGNVNIVSTATKVSVGPKLKLSLLLATVELQKHILVVSPLVVTAPHKPPIPLGGVLKLSRRVEGL
jgi:hypothetical protein|tara:strand:+ start:100 stop:360 length:261 start_codon:yes stop_codon:yes gene_type:complete